MKTIMILGILLPFLALSSFAQTSDPVAKAILDKVTKKTQSYETMKFEFTYTMVDTKEGINESKSGSIYIKGDKYRLYIADQIVICDGVTIWTYLKEDNEVQINDVDPNNDQTPNKMLTTYGENYKAKFIKEIPKGGKMIQIIDLTPNTAKSYYKVRLEIDKTESMVVSSTIYDKNQTTTYTYRVDVFTPNPKVAESRFTFNAADYPGVTVNDMR